MRTKALTLALAACALLGSERARAATVFFSTFDTDVTGWQTVFAGGTLSWDAADELGGSGSARLSDLTPDSTASIFSACVAVTPGTTVTFGGAIRAVGGGVLARARARFHDDAACDVLLDGIDGDLNASLPISTWAPVQGTHVVPTGATHMSLWFRVSTGNPAPSAFYLDNAYLVTDKTCVNTATTRCLNDERFRLTATWQKPDGEKGAARIVKLTDDAAYLWFFNANNIEVVAKVLDACSLNDRFWVFAAGLTNVEVNLRVTDTVTGESWQRENPLGQAFAPIQDTGALATCSM